MNIGIIGGSGYGGAELLRLLAQHPVFEVSAVTAGTAAGQNLADVFPHLGLRYELLPTEPASVAGCEVVFLATPHGASLEIINDLRAAGNDALIVDLSGGFRLNADEYPTWYGFEHTMPEHTPAVYGLPELFRHELPGANLIAGPGCYPTATLLGLAPIVDLIDASAISVVGMSGASGAGRSLRDNLHTSHAAHNTGAYAAPDHRHTPEIAHHLRRRTAQDVSITFIPHLVPQVRGMIVTSTARLHPTLADGTTSDVNTIVWNALKIKYENEPFVTVLEPGEWPQSTHTLGSNIARIGVAVDMRAPVPTVIVSSAIDNLTKGAAGQAIQSANAALGIPEIAGLPTSAVYP